jgi:hypothetical protein
MTKGAVIVSLTTVTLVAACSNSGNGFGDGGTDGGKSIGDNPNVTAACQTCVNQSSGNDCASQQKNCLNDADCSALNACVNKCANVTSGCINNCAMAASPNAQSEWINWYDCICADCGSQCNSTFCGLLSADAGSDSPSCLGSGAACTMEQQCCSSARYCLTPGGCANCVPSNFQCNSDQECCSASCDSTGTGLCQ